MRKFVTDMKQGPLENTGDKIYQAYLDVKKSGMMYEWYPQLTGDWEKDRIEWYGIYIESVRYIDKDIKPTQVTYLN